MGITKWDRATFQTIETYTFITMQIFIYNQCVIVLYRYHTKILIQVKLYTNKFVLISKSYGTQPSLHSSKSLATVDQGSTTIYTGMDMTTSIPRGEILHTHDRSKYIYTWRIYHAIYYVMWTFCQNQFLSSNYASQSVWNALGNPKRQTDRQANQPRR